MSRSRTRRAEPLRDVRQFWLERGFRPDVATIKSDPDDDPKGEAAYQRAFYEAEQLEPPRLPNPSSFPNSPSAREYLQQRSRDTLQSGQKRSGDPAAELLRVTRKARDPDRSPSVLSKTSTSPASNYSASAVPYTSTLLSTPRMAEDLKPNFTSSQHLQPGGYRPTAIEPFGAPSGPANPFQRPR